MVAEEFFTAVNRQGEERMFRNNAQGKRVFEEDYAPNGWKVVEKEPDYDPTEDLKRQRELEAEEAKKAKEAAAAEEAKRKAAEENKDK